MNHESRLKNDIFNEPLVDARQARPTASACLPASLRRWPGRVHGRANPRDFFRRLDARLVSTRT